MQGVRGSRISETKCPGEGRVQTFHRPIGAFIITPLSSYLTVTTIQKYSNSKGEQCLLNQHIKQCKKLYKYLHKSWRTLFLLIYRQNISILLLIFYSLIASVDNVVVMTPKHQFLSFGFCLSLHYQTVIDTIVFSLLF